MASYQPVGVNINNQTIELPETKRKILDAGVQIMRSKGFSATSVDDVCLGAGVSKGAFFHYFKSKDELARAAADIFSENNARQIHDAPFKRLTDPLARVFGRLDFVRELAGGSERVTKGCLIGMFAQELSSSHPELRRVCQESFCRVARDFEQDLTEAKAQYAPQAGFTPKRLALMYVAMVQGSLMMAKTADSNDILAENLEQFRQCLQSLFGLPQSSAASPLN
jgi:TetR/AcrR family transcriptional repressor of nem operon